MLGQYERCGSIIRSVSTRAVSTSGYEWCGSIIRAASTQSMLGQYARLAQGYASTYGSLVPVVCWDSMEGVLAQYTRPASTIR
eukprot:1957824-Rhodomonas_salina.1